jgi:outer membrane protein TolC
MREMMGNRTQGRRAAAIALGVVLAMGVPLGAQQTGAQQAGAPQAPAPGPAGQAPAPAAGAKVLQLSMAEAVAMSMEANLGLKSQRLNVDVAAQNIVSAHASFLPQLRGNLSRQVTDRPSSSFTDVSSATISSNNLAAGATLNQTLPWYGGSYTLNFNNGRSATSSVGATFNPTLSSSFTVAYTQPLLQGFKLDSARVGVETSERQREIADLDLQAQMITLQAQVRDAYLNLVGAIETRKVVGENMDSAQRQLDQAKRKVSVGTLAQIDVIQTEANVATNQVSVISAEAQIASAQDVLRSLILDPARPDYWDIEFQATDTIPEAKPQAFDVNVVTSNALANRLDLLSARKNLAITGLNVRLDQDLTKPTVNAGVTYQASGTGGVINSYSQTFPPTLLSQSAKSLGSTLGEAFSGAYPSWTVGLNITYPIGTTSARSNLARAQIQEHQQQINLKNLETQVTAAVRQAVRDVETAAQRVVAAAASLSANEKQYEAEKRKEEVGLSTTFDVLQKQTLLASARLTDIQARIQYSQALLNLDRVQKIR